MRDLVRQLLLWPLYSVRRLVATVAVLTAAVLGLVALTSAGGGQPTAAPGPGTPGTRPPSASPSRPAPTPSTSPSRDYGRAIDIAKAFVAAWASHPKDQTEWYVATARYATDHMARKLTTVDMRNVPAEHVTGRARLTDTGGVGQTQVAVPTDGGVVSVILVPHPKAGWRVDDLQPGAQKEQ
ncbi:hypothetical protein [Streptomyces sp. NPDC059009]|uniref:hypothetical protein n=1 Tax=Streptomyces sp. NPDC059009 TaxID=3346694 RepID=UPI003679C4D4